MTSKNLPAIESLIPHRAAMMLIDRVTDIEDDRIVTIAVVKENWPLCDRAGADVILTVEIIAQSVAALYHRRKKRPGTPQIDFLVGIKEARFETQKLPLHAELTARVQMVSFIGNYGIFKGEVLMVDEILCETTVQVLEPDEELWEAILSGHTREVSDDE
ncbi:MAG: hypothetical protein JXA41_09015 [Deltaproteobacteria bacterium]|nr:hypothetical protein [Deltaproteobacteria bacterium]